MKAQWVLTAVALCLMSRPAPGDRDSESDPSRAVVRLLYTIAEGVNAGDAEEVLSAFERTDALVSYMPGGETLGFTAFERNLRAELAQEGSVHLSFDQVRALGRGETAFAAAHWSEAPLSHGSADQSHHGRYTVVARRVRGEWHIVQEHMSRD
jgi:uncharacterized protein (TIGR02246 family)